MTRGLVLLMVSATAARAGETVVDFGTPTAPRLRFDVTLDGKPPEAAWENAVGKLFAYLDRNGDGKLDAAERAILAAPVRRKNTPATPDVGFELVGKLAFPPDAATMDRAGFDAALRAAGLGPTVVRFGPTRANAQLSAALFKHLDADGDGKLSRAELAAARERLASLDVNEDELLSGTELLSVMASNRSNGARLGRANAGRDATSTELVLLDAAEAQAVKQLLGRKGPKATTLARADLSMSVASFAARDRNGDGQLDAAELAAWLRSPPEDVAVLALSTSPNAPLTNKVLRLAGGEWTTQTIPRYREWPALAEAIEKGFRALAKDGRLAKAALKGQPQLAAVFDFADRDGDGTLTDAELKAFLAAFAPLAEFRADVTISEEGRVVFERLDTNGDGQLSLRELASAVTVFQDALSKGPFALADLPRHFTASAEVAGLRWTILEPANSAPGMMASSQAKPAIDAPAWFLKMDRNGDGDVSRKEFLGPLELFRKIDADGDGLISPAEAKAWRN